MITQKFFFPKVPVQILQMSPYIAAIFMHVTPFWIGVIPTYSGVSGQRDILL